MKTFNELARILTTARNPMTGKPTEANTRIRLVDGTVMDPKVIAVKFYNTDVLKYYPDGSIDLVTGWERSPTTRQRIYAYSGIRLYTQALPLFNRRQPDPKQVVCVSHKGDGHIISHSVNGYIRYNPDGTINLNTVREREFQIWKNQKRYRELMNHGRAICDQISALQKLGFRYTNSSDRNIEDWFLEQLERPLDQVVVAEAPVRGATFTNGLMVPRLTLTAMAWRIGKRFDLVDVVSLKKFFR